MPRLVEKRLGLLNVILGNGVLQLDVEEIYLIAVDIGSIIIIKEFPEFRAGRLPDPLTVPVPRQADGGVDVPVTQPLTF